jgi:hypothetical protein
VIAVLLTMPEYIAAAVAEREEEARRVAAAHAWERAVGRSGPGVAGALRLLLREVLWTLAGVDLPPAAHHAPRTLNGTALRGAR